MTIKNTPKLNILGPRGFLSNYPDDVVYVVNGKPVTKGDMLDAKRERQAILLAAKRRSYEPIIKPCFIWVFWTQGLGGTGFFREWWLYIQTSRRSWQICREYRQKEFSLKVMRLYPCGYLPMIENLEPWKAAFAEAYHYPTRKRPDRQGMALAWAKVSPGGMLLDIISTQEVKWTLLQS